MLDSIRKRKENFVSLFIILAIVAVMALYGVDKATQTDASGGVAAYVNGEAITAREFRQELENTLARYQAMFGGQFDEKLFQSPQILQGTLQQLVKTRLLGQQSKKLHVLVTNDELADHIRSLPYFQKDGKFDAEGYSRIPNRGADEKRQREQLQTAKWYSYLTDRVRMTPRAIKEGYLLKETKLDLEYAKIDFAKLAPKKAAGSAEIQTFLKSSEPQVKQYFDTHKDDFTEKGENNLRQIRVAIPFQATEKQKAASKTKIDEIAKLVTADNFEKIAREKSDDEYAKKGGNRGWVAAGALEKEVEAALVKLTPKQVSPVIQTSFGYFIVQLIEKKEAKPLAFDSVKNKIAETLINEKAAKEWSEKTQSAWEATVKEGKSLDSELKKYKVELKKTGPFQLSQGYIPSLGQNDAILDAVMELTPASPVAKKLFFVQDGFYYVKLSKLEIPKLTDLEKQAPEVDRTIASGLQSELVTHWIEDLEKKASIKYESSGKGKGPQTPAESSDG